MRLPAYLQKGTLLSGGLCCAGPRARSCHTPSRTRVCVEGMCVSMLGEGDDMRVSHERRHKLSAKAKCELLTVTYLKVPFDSPAVVLGVCRCRG